MGMNFRNWLIIHVLLIVSLNTHAEETFNSYDLKYRADLSLEFNDFKSSGFERRKLTDQLRVRGWQVGRNTYFGQARVDDRWGLGFVVDRGDTIYGINHHGIQVLKKF